MTFAQVMEVIIDKGYSRMPVFGESQDDIRGVLYARDLLPLYRPEHHSRCQRCHSRCRRGHRRRQYRHPAIPQLADPDFRWQSLIRKPYFRA